MSMTTVPRAGAMRFFVDPWDPNYGASLEADMTSTTGAVTIDVERPLAEWAPITPGPGTRVPDCVVFVDGVRRLEARTWIDADPGPTQAGIFASYAAGAVRCDTAAKIAEVVVGRGVYSPAPALVDVETRHGTFQAHRTTDETPETLMYSVHAQMSEC